MNSKILKNLSIKTLVKIINTNQDKNQLSNKVKVASSLMGETSTQADRVTGFNRANKVFQENKFGYINIQELLSIMPERKMFEIETKTSKLEIEKMITKLKSILKELEKGRLLQSESWKEKKKKELKLLQQKIEERQQQYRLEIEKINNRLFVKASEAIKNVAEENGYTYIFKSNAIFYAKESENIFEKVKINLNNEFE